MRMNKAAAVICLLVTFAWAGAAQATEIKVLCSNNLRTAMEDLIPQFERETGHKVVAEFGTAISLGRRIEQGDAFDLAVVTPSQMDALIPPGKIVPGTRTPIARMGMALAIPAGGRRFDISTAEALKRSLVSAKSIAYPKEGTAGVYFTALIKRLGIEQALAASSRPKAGGADVGAAVSSGEAELGVLPVSEILPVRGAELLGLFPAEVQEYVLMVGGVGTAAKEGHAARQLLAFITSPSSRALMIKKGLELPQ
ncbi:MAG: molybdate ABC transporter substrate-binding protein [Acidobacteria bacterium]|nr:molybdate ABC transporter substrate-binding protein [Acidobacteriota bacterium]